MIKTISLNFFFMKVIGVAVVISSFWTLMISFPFILESIGIIVVMLVQSVLGIKSTFLNFTPEYVSNYGLVFLSSLILFFNSWFGFFAGVSFFKSEENYRKIGLIYLILSSTGLFLFSFSIFLINFAYLNLVTFVNNIVLALNFLLIFFLILDILFRKR